MPTEVIVRNIRDTYVTEVYPKKNYNAVNRLKLSGDPARETYSFLFWARPFPLGATITSAKLQVWNDGTWVGPITLSAQRLIAAWAGSRINFDNRPTITSTEYSMLKTGAPSQTMWEIDLTPLMQAVSGGSPWYGIRLKANGNSMKSLFSAQAAQAEFRPRVIIQWSDAPTQPTALAPSNNRKVANPKPMLTYAYNDLDGEGDLTAQQIQVSSVSTFASTTFDSGWVTTSDAQFDLSTSTYAGIAANSYMWWRVRVRDAGGLESVWSEPSQVGYVPKATFHGDNTFGTKSINGVTDQAYVEDSSPPIFWAMGPSRTQTAYQVKIFDTANMSKPKFDSGKISGSGNSIDTNQALLTTTVRPYELRIYAWDEIDREKNGSDPVAYVYTKQFWYAPNGTIEAPVLESITSDYPWPWVFLTFSRPTPPDSFSVWRDDELVENNIDPGSVDIGGGKFKWRDRAVSPRVNHRWEVRANVNSVDSDPSNSKLGITKPSVTWMMELDNSNPICLLKSSDRPAPVVDASSNNMQETHQPIGGGAPVLITQFLSGFEGHVDAVLSDDALADGSLTARVMRNRFKAWKRRPGTKLLLFMVDEALTIVPYNMTYRPRAVSGGQVIYDVSFDFFEDS